MHEFLLLSDPCAGDVAADIDTRLAFQSVIHSLMFFYALLHLAIHIVHCV